MQLIVAPIVSQSKGKEVANLQEALLLFIQKEIIRALDAPNKPTVDELKRLTRLLQVESKETIYGDATTQLVLLFQLQQQFSDSMHGSVDEATAKAMNGILRQLGALDTTEPPEPPKPPVIASFNVTGMVSDNSGAPLNGYIAELFVITIDNAISVGKATTDRNGQFSVSFARTRAMTAPDLEVRAYREGQRVFSKSAIRFNAKAEEVIDVIVPAEKLSTDSEFNSLLAELRPHLGQLQINDLKEDGDTKQITYLSNKTGWDGRITAMVASAHKLGNSLSIDPSHIYALLRSGIPATEDEIKSVSLEKAEAAINSAISKNIVPASSDAKATIKMLGALSTEFVLKSKPNSAISSLDDVLSLRLNADQKNLFAQAQKLSAGDGEKLWSDLSQRGFSADLITQLQTDGKMNYLTGQNASLVKRTYDKFNIKVVDDLATSGLYKAEEWKSVIGNDVPEGISSDEYALHLANQVKLSFPTAVASEMIKRREVDLGANAPIQEVSGFFDANKEKKVIGSQPVKTWEGFDRLSTAGKASAKLMERLYQITPSDEAMSALSKTGLTSAYQVTRFTKSEFMASFGKAFPSDRAAELTYTKASEVYSASIGIATGYLTSRTMANVYSITGKLSRVQNATIAYPTLEDLLGNMDYCACDHCKSVLSPAAYMVELLQFLDLDGVSHTKSNPIDELFARRPDLQHIQLSCENTNMALPYLDLVNEILEHYILNGNLNTLKGHDITEEVTQSELLAEPKFVKTAAYDELKTKVFPYNLPFHQSLETLRRLFKVWDVSLEQMLSVFSSPLQSRKETLAFSDEDYRTITDVGFKQLPEYFGEPAGNSITQLNAAIATGKVFSRRVGISYEELVKLLKTNFINPGYSIVPLFEKLRLSLADANRFFTGDITGAQLNALISEDALPDDYGGNIQQWLTDNRETILGLITLTDVSEEESECSFAAVELRYALPVMASNRLTAISYHKFHRFLRLKRKTGWSIETLDSIIKALLPVPSDEITLANIDEVFVRLFDRIVNFKKIADHLSYSEKKFTDLLLVVDASNTVALRQEQTAKIVKLSQPEIAELIAFTSIDPLVSDLETDTPSLIRFITTAQRLKAASLKVSDLAYLLHHVDLTGKLTLTGEEQLRNIKLIRDAITAVEKEHIIAPDNADFLFAKNKMLLVYDAATTDHFFGLLMGTYSVGVPFNTVQEVLPTKILNVDPAIALDPFKKQLTYSGILSAATGNLLSNAADTLVVADMSVLTTQPELNAFISDFKAAVTALVAESNADLVLFADNNPELKVIYDSVIAEITPEARTLRLVNLILPELKTRLKRNAIRQALAGILKSENDVVNVLTSKPETIRSSDDITQAVIHDFVQLETTLVPDQNATYNFYLDVPASDDYILYFAAPANTVINLTVEGSNIISNLAVPASGEVKNTVPLSLTAGVLHPAELTVSSLPAAQQVVFSWRTKAIQKAVVPSSAIYHSAKVAFALTSLARLTKATQLQTLFRFTPSELEHFASVDTETSGLLNAIDTNGSIAPPDLLALWNKLELLIGFNEIKKANEPEENTWLSILRDPSVQTSQGKLLLEYFNIWQEPDVVAVLAHFGMVRADLSRLSALRKFNDAMLLLSNIYYPAADVLTWVSHDPSYALVAGIKATIKQKVTEAVWLETMKSVNDPVRNLLRDALVSYILEYKKPSAEITNSDKLYEYFLVDVEMTSCMQTSRIRLALSTIQLFVQRCLMNLEPKVDPSSIRADHWAWMKRYRVWEANRKVFLYPENWLEPELRDNKSSMFKELEGELLQAEITDESAELAFLNYLKKLDDIAKLDITGMYLEENELGNQDDDILHVFARSNGLSRQHYYRRYEYGYWTPWEKISLNIEGDHLFPVVWRKKLFVFWLSIVEKADDVTDVSPQTQSTKSWKDQKRLNVEVNICWGEYFKGKWTSPKSTELRNPMKMEGMSAFNPAKLNLFARKERVENPVGKFRERLIFYLRYRGLSQYGSAQQATFTFTSKNAAPYLDYEIDSFLYDNITVFESFTFTHPFSHTPDAPQLDYTQLAFPARDMKVQVKQPAGAVQNVVLENILTKKNALTKGFSLTPLRHPVKNQYEAPLAYMDEHSTFLLTPDEQVFLPLRFYQDYFPYYEAPFIYEEIPELVERPGRGWPPEEMINPGEDVIINQKWNWMQNGARVNENFSKMLPVADSFNFGGVLIDTAGINAGAGKQVR